MQARLGAEWENFAAALEAPPPTSVRLHPEKGADLFPQAAPIPWHPLGRRLPERPAFEEEPLWHAGAYYVQEASGMSVRVFVPQRRPLRVIDLSAAPGGKATLLLGELGWEGGLLIANDPDPRRRLALQENLERWGIPAYLLTGRHPQWWAQHYPGSFDLVVLDAPCSGEGLWRKDPAAACHWRPELAARLQRLQRNLLRAAQTLVAPGGTLLYATCTFNPAENEENIAWAFAALAEWEPLAWPGSPPEAITPVQAGVGWGYYFYPHRGPGEGFFLSAWRRKGSPRDPSFSRPPTSRAAPLTLPEGLLAGEKGGRWWALTEAAAQLVPSTLWAANWEAFPLWQHHRPAHAAALLSRPFPKPYPERPLHTLDEFLAYLRGQIHPPQAPVEWVSYAGRGLGWLYKGKPSLPFTWRRFLRPR